MLDIGMQELIVIFVVALLVFGPKRLPELARTLGKGVAQAKKAVSDIKDEVRREMQEEVEAIDKAKAGLPSLKDLQKPLKDVEGLKFGPPQYDNTKSEPEKAEEAGEGGDEDDGRGGARG